NQSINPYEISLPAMNIRIESQIKIFQAPVSFRASCIVNTPVIIKIVTARKATKVASNCGILKKPDKTHKTIERMKTDIIIFSGVDIGPIFANFSSAHFLASGVSLISGGYIL